MMTRVFQGCILWAIFLIGASSGVNAQEIFLNDSTEYQLPEEFYLFNPVYTNPLQLKEVKATTYIISKVSKSSFLDNLSLGLYLACFDNVSIDSITTTNLYQEYPITQLIKKQADGYLGYLEELLNVPFVLPPKKLKAGHQTDLRLGVDCAELAIYGRRRMGYPIPYIGPRGIIKYLAKADKVERGTVICFGNSYQISVVYEDRGTIGVLDKEDLLIHAYKDKAEIVLLGDTDLHRYRYSIYFWKE